MPSLDELVREAPPFRGSVEEYIDEVALWLKERVGVYTPALLLAIIRKKAENDKRLQRAITWRRVYSRLIILEKKGLIRLRRV